MDILHTSEGYKQEGVERTQKIFLINLEKKNLLIERTVKNNWEEINDFQSSENSEQEQRSNYEDRCLGQVSKETCTPLKKLYLI